MPKYLIERRVPGVGKMGPADLKALSGKSNDTLDSLRKDGRDVQWVQSYVTDDTIHCVYLAGSPEDVLEHARCGGFPADNVMRVQTMIDPTTAE